MIEIVFVMSRLEASIPFVASSVNIPWGEGNCQTELVVLEVQIRGISQTLDATKAPATKAQAEATSLSLAATGAWRSSTPH